MSWQKNYKPGKEHMFPDELIHIPNVEKQYHESWVKGRNLLNFPHPYRMLLLGGVNSGKTNIIKNIVLRANPKFVEIFLYHCGGSYTKEYEDIEFTCLEEIPDPDDERFDPKQKKLLIIEDKEFKFMAKDELKRLDRAFGYVSTHRNLSIICTGQDFFNLPAPVRRMSNIFVIWKTKDLDTLKTIGRRLGFTKDELVDLIRSHLKKPRDSLWLDGTFETPGKVRVNGFQVLQGKETKQQEEEKINGK